MKSVCFYFHVHQPYRVKKYRIYDVGYDPEYFNDRSVGMLNNKAAMEDMARRVYIPATKLIIRLLKMYPQMRVAYSFSGVTLEQMERYAPEALELFKQVIATEQAEILGETYYHSLSFFFSPAEFERQVVKHREIIQRIFNVRPHVFHNTGLAYRNDLGAWAEKTGFAGVVAEGWDPIMGWKSPNYVYRPSGAARTRLLMKNYRLSDDITQRFSSREWNEWPLTPEKYGRWINETEGEVINLFIPYEALGGLHGEDSGIFHFLEMLPATLQRNPDVAFHTPSEVLLAHEPKEEIDVPYVLTGEGSTHDLSVWTGNPMQKAAIDTLYGMEDDVMLANDGRLLEDWRKMQTADHFYQMSTRSLPQRTPLYESPYDAYIAYMNALSDLQRRVAKVRG